MEHFRQITFIMFLVAASLLGLLITSTIGPDTPTRKATSKFLLGLIALLSPFIILVLPSIIDKVTKLFEF